MLNFTLDGVWGSTGTLSSADPETSEEAGETELRNDIVDVISVNTVLSELLFAIVCGLLTVFRRLL